jgi:phosphotransferase system  glucose/maltose/N-acetylglucosamine-specific IIC component
MPVYLTPEQLNARNRRNLWIALGLVAFIVVIFLSTFLRMQRNLAERTAQQQAVAEQVR